MIFNSISNELTKHNLQSRQNLPNFRSKINSNNMHQHWQQFEHWQAPYKINQIGKIHPIEHNVQTIDSPISQLNHKLTQDIQIIRLKSKFRASRVISEKRSSSFSNKQFDGVRSRVSNRSRENDNTKYHLQKKQTRKSGMQKIKVNSDRFDRSDQKVEKVQHQQLLYDSNKPTRDRYLTSTPSAKHQQKDQFKYFHREPITLLANFHQITPKEQRNSQFQPSYHQNKYHYQPPSTIKSQQTFRHNFQQPVHESQHTHTEGEEEFFQVNQQRANQLKSSQIDLLKTQSDTALPLFKKQITSKSFHEEIQKLSPLNLQNSDEHLPQKIAENEKVRKKDENGKMVAGGLIILGLILFILQALK